MRENCEVNYGLGSVNETHERESVAETGYKWKEKRSHLKKKSWISLKFTLTTNYPIISTLIVNKVDLQIYT